MKNFLQMKWFESSWVFLYLFKAAGTLWNRIRCARYLTCQKLNLAFYFRFLKALLLILILLFCSTNNTNYIFKGRRSSKVESIANKSIGISAHLCHLLRSHWCVQRTWVSLALSDPDIISARPFFNASHEIIAEL